MDGSCYYVSDVQNLKYTIEALLQCGIRRSGILVGSGILHQMVQHFRETQCVVRYIYIYDESNSVY